VTDSAAIPQLKQAWPEPGARRPIVIVAGGGIVRDAHIPAYKKGGYRVLGVYDIDREAAEARAREAGGAKVFDSMTAATAEPDVIYDVASRPEDHLALLDQLPDGAAVLLQKPMGRHIEEARAIVELCRRKKLKAAVNFQLRFSPQMLAIRDFIDQGHLGELVDIEFHLNLKTPWEMFPFLQKLERVEILVHTVHHLDMVRAIAGDPKGVYARTVAHPTHPKLRQTKTSAILDYGDTLRCCLSINHCHPFGETHEAATVRIEGTEGCAVTRLGLLLNYPEGKPDKLEVVSRATGGWVEIPLAGRWFPDAFIGTMANVQRFANGEDTALVSSVEDAFHTMALVEACYTSSARGGEPLPTF
jgi:predicted dehydrogenase